MSFAWRSHLPLLLVPLLACSPDKDPLDGVTQGPTGSPTAGPTGGSNSGGSNSGGSNSGSSTDDPTGGGSGTDSAGTATSGDTGGSGVHSSCEQYLQCVSAVAPEAYRQSEQAYGPNSTCWQLTPEIEQMCIEACEQGLAAYGMSYPDEPACGGSGGTSTSTTTNTTLTTQTTQTSETDPSETGGAGHGNCGWVGGNSYYACGFPGELDPEGTSPIDCPDPLPAMGDACDENSPVNGIGCCTPTGANYYCSVDNIVEVEECGA
jgi:hypothetical protein